MKKIIFLIIFLGVLCMSGCSDDNQLNRVPSNLKEITGRVVKATLNENQEIVINKEEITFDVTYISYEYEGVVIGLIAVRDSNGKVMVVVNTCQSCGGSPYAYFVQVGDSLQCQNCGSVFEIDQLDNLIDGGCNPIAIMNKSEDDDTIIINTEELNSLKDKFENWMGPK